MITCGIFLYSRAKQKLLACHATHSRWTQWSIPKGLLMEGEEPLPAALRELQEETGIDLGLIMDAKVTSLPPVKYQKQNKILNAFLVITNNGFEDHVFHSNLAEGLDFAEIDSWKWLSLEQAEKSLHEAQRSLMPKIREILV